MLFIARTIHCRSSRSGTAARLYCAPWQAQHWGRGYCVGKGTRRAASRRREPVTARRFAPNSLLEAHTTRFHTMGPLVGGTTSCPFTCRAKKSAPTVSLWRTRLLLLIVDLGLHHLITLLHHLGHLAHHLHHSLHVAVHHHAVMDLRSGVLCRRLVFGAHHTGNGHANARGK